MSVAEPEVTVKVGVPESPPSNEAVKSMEAGELAPAAVEMQIQSVPEPYAGAMFTPAAQLIPTAVVAAPAVLALGSALATLAFFHLHDNDVDDPVVVAGAVTGLALTPIATGRQITVTVYGAAVDVVADLVGFHSPTA